MLHVLRLRDQTGVEHVRLRLLRDELLAFFEQSFHSVALLATRTFIQVLEDAIEALDLPPGDPLVIGKGLLELAARRGLDHAGQCLENLPFGAVQVFELIHIERAQ